MESTNREVRWSEEGDEEVKLLLEGKEGGGEESVGGGGEEALSFRSSCRVIQ